MLGSLGSGTEEEKDDLFAATAAGRAGTKLMEGNSSASGR